MLTIARVNTTFHPLYVNKSSAGYGCVCDGKVSSAEQWVKLRYPAACDMTANCSYTEALTTTECNVDMQPIEENYNSPLVAKQFIHIHIHIIVIIKELKN